jgi:curli biogenesis system outer membrane secretion channel CsgG
MSTTRARWRLLTGCALMAALVWPAIAQCTAQDAAAADRRIPLSERKRIAVLPFEDGAVRESSYYGRVFEVGRGVADMLTTALVKTNKFRVIEREKVDAVMAEQDLGKTGRVDAETAARIGKILGVEYLLTGRVTAFSVETKGGSIGALGRGDLRDLSLKRSTADVKLDGRLVDSTTGEIIFAFTDGGRDSRADVGLAVLDVGRIRFGSEEFSRTILGAATRAAVDNSVKEIASAANELIYRPPDLSKINGYVVYLDGPNVMTNLGGRYGVKVGDRFQVLRPGKEVRDPQTGELLTVITTPIGVLRVDRVEEKVSTGVLAEKATGAEVQIGDVVKPVAP